LLKSAEDEIAGLDVIELEQSEEVWQDVFTAIRGLLRMTKLRRDLRFTARLSSDLDSDPVPPRSFGEVTSAAPG